MTASLLARAALVAAVLAAAVVLVSLQRSEDACTDALKGMFFALRDDAPEGILDGTLGQIEEDCPGSARLVDAGAVLFEQGRADRAAALLRVAVEREPDNFSAWAGLASVLARTDRAASDEAAARAARLNPFYRPPS